MGRKRRIDPSEDALFGDAMDLEGIPEQNYTYTQLGVSEKTAQLEEKAKKVISSLAKAYFDAEELEADAYQQMIQDIEAMTLSSLFVQVMFGKHMLATLMDRLDQGEHTNNGIYRLIMDVQNNLLHLTMQVSMHVRNLPAFFKHIQKELIDSGKIVAPLLQVGPKADDKLLSDGQRNLAAPQKGMRDLLKSIEEELQRDKEDNVEDAIVVEPDKPDNKSEQ